LAVKIIQKTNPSIKQQIIRKLSTEED